jgi:hypothetical protein
VAIIGACSEASCLTLKVALQVRPQTARATASAVALRLGWQMALRIKWQESPDVPCGTGWQVTVGFALPIGPRAGLRVDSGEPFGVTVETTPGTVPGTVPTVVPGRSIPTSWTVPNALLCC